MTTSITREEAEAIVAGKTSPKITSEYIESLITNVQYIHHDTTTIAVVTVRNGFRFVGTSTPASKENFDEKVGELFAKDNAIKHIWSHEGYLLRELLYQSEQ